MNCNYQKFFEELNNIVEEHNTFENIVRYSKETIDKFFNALNELAENSISEQFANLSKLQQHYRSHVLRVNDNRKSKKHDVYYDHMSLNNYQKLEQSFNNFSYDNAHLITMYDLENNLSLDKIDNLFDNRDYIVIEAMNNLQYIFKADSVNTTNYVDNNKVFDFYVKDKLITKTLFPIHEEILLNRAFAILFEEYDDLNIYH